MEELAACRNLLIAGMGGGFDVFCGLPIYFELTRRGQSVHLASLSFSQLAYLKNGFTLSDGLAGVMAQSSSLHFYFPELHLARWFQEERGEAVTIWCFNAQAAQPLLAQYRRLIEHLHVDGILLVDGGVDGLMRGDEAELGTVLEDAFSLAAISALEDVPLRLMTCVGFGAEEDVTYSHVFENLAALTKAGGFRGVCSLAPHMEAYHPYRAALEYAGRQRLQEPSVINTSIVSAVQGEYGDFHATEKTKGSRLWISPLMPLYWFFDAQAVADRNLFLPELRHSQTRVEAMAAIAACRNRMPLRKAYRIPL